LTDKHCRIEPDFQQAASLQRLIENDSQTIDPMMILNIQLKAPTVTCPGLGYHYHPVSPGFPNAIAFHFLTGKEIF